MTSMNAVDVWLSCARRLLAGAALLFLSLSGSVAMSVSAHAAEQESAAGTSDAKLSFDIASQPLEDALYTFGAVTGIEVFVDGGAVKERRSTEVRGSFTVSQALRLLLTGTGLEAQSIGVRAITLTQPPPIPARQGGAPGGQAAQGEIVQTGNAGPGLWELFRGFVLDSFAVMACHSSFP